MVLVPIKAFHLAKNRLAEALDPPARERLARQLAERVVAAAAPLPVFVVCEDQQVAEWARAHGAAVIPGVSGGLSATVEHGVAQLHTAGFAYACVAHADLPAAVSLAQLGGFAGATFVPDRHDDGTNVVCVPTDAGFRFAYGPARFGAM